MATACAHMYVRQRCARAQLRVSTVGDILQVQAQPRLLAGERCGSSCVFWVAGGDGGVVVTVTGHMDSSGRPCARAVR